MKMPKELRGPITVSDDGAILAPYFVHLICVFSLGRTIDHYLYFNPSNYTHSDLSKDPNQPSTTNIVWGSTYYYVPIVSLDGYAVLLLENCTKEAKTALSEMSDDDSYGSDIDISKMNVIMAYGLDDVKTYLLSAEGIKQYKNLCLAKERYDLLAKLQNEEIKWQEKE